MFMNVCNYIILMKIHLQVPDNEVSKLVSNSFESSRKIYLEFSLFRFAPWIIPSEDSTTAMFSMFSDLGMLTK